MYKNTPDLSEWVFHLARPTHLRFAQTQRVAAIVRQICTLIPATVNLALIYRHINNFSSQSALFSTRSHVELVHKAHGAEVPPEFLLGNRFVFVAILVEITDIEIERRFEFQERVRRRRTGLILGDFNMKWRQSMSTRDSLPLAHPMRLEYVHWQIYAKSSNLQFGRSFHCLVDRYDFHYGT